MDEMKDSGIALVGPIPQSWGVSRLGYESYIRARLGWKGLKANEYVEEGYAFISAFNIQDGRMCWYPLNYITKERYDESPEIKLSIGDVLLVKDGAGVGKSARVDELPEGETAPNSSLAVITPFSRLDYKYLSYYLQSPAFTSFVLELINGMGVPHLTQEIMRKIQILIPSLDAQIKIADLLDERCAEIYGLSADIQSEIEILEAYKRSVITETVTKGLDKNAPMKDSGVFYMAPMNANWRLTKIGYICTKLFRPFDSEDAALICSNKGKVSVRPDSQVGIMTSEDNAMQGIVKGDIAIHGMDTWHGAIALSGMNGKITRVVHVCDSTEENRFIVYYLQHLAFQGVYKLISNGVRGNTSDFRSWDKVRGIFIALPETIEEQQRICDYLDEVCREVDEIIAQKQEQLAVLADYKKSVIYEYVTGKKEVPAI